MSGQSDKKNKKKSQSANQMTLIFIGIATGLYIIMNLYSIIFKGKQITKGQIFGFPCFKRGQCGFKRDSKLKAISSFDVGSTSSSISHQ